MVCCLGAEIVGVLKVQRFVRSALRGTISCAGLLIAYNVGMALEEWVRTENGTPIAQGIDRLALCELLTFVEYWT